MGSGIPGIMFDHRDYELLGIVNDVLDHNESFVYLKNLLYPYLHPRGIKEMAASRGVRIAYAAVRLLESLEAGKADDRLTALRCLRDEVMHSGESPMQKNTARVLLEIMKELVRARDNKVRQLELAHDFRSAASGKPRIVRALLRRYYLLEMPDIAPYNDLETTSRIISEHSREIAAVIVEPLHRCTIPLPGFLKGLREITGRHGILLIFDECVTGFRLAYGGAQEYYGVIPDLAALGKALGGGYPVGAVAGRAEILDLCHEARLGRESYVWFASTLGGNPVTAAAALATLEELRKPGSYEQLFYMGEKLRQGFRAILDDLGITAQVLGDGPLCALSFTAEEVVDYRSSFRADSSKARAFVLGLFRNGIFLNPMSTKLYISLAHSDADIAAIHEAGRRVLQEMQD